MLAYRFGALALLATLVRPAAVVATTANDICLASANPCVLNTAVTVGTASTLDFGARRFRMTSRGRLRIPFGDTLTIRARSVTLEPGALIDHAAGAGSAAADLVVEALEDIRFQRSGNTGARVSLSAPTGQGSMSLRAGGNVVVDGDLVVAITGSGGNGGTVDIMAGGDARVGGDVRVFGGPVDGRGGNLMIKADGAVVVNGPFVDAAGGGSGGNVSLDAGIGLTTAATLDVSATGPGTSAGSVTLKAAADVRLQGPIVGTGRGSVDFGGSGADVTIDAGGSILLSAPMTVSGGGIDGEGGLVEVNAGIDIIQTAAIAAFGGGTEGAGNTVDFAARRLLRLAASIDVHGGAEGDGGAVTGLASEIRAEAGIDVDGDSGSIDLLTVASTPGGLVVAGPVSVSGDLHALGIGEGFGGDIGVQACDVTIVGGARLDTRGAPAGTNVLQSSRQLTVGGILTATPGGANRFDHRDGARPPNILGSANIMPAPTTRLVPTLPPCVAPTAVCGNGGPPETGEGCDDGNTTACDGCSATCQREACGNGVRECAEACDDGDANDGDGCDSNCTVTACGNGIVTRGEQCDDGNRTGGDGCSSACVLERPVACGNRVVNLGEQCDDGNAVACDGCSPFCLAETCGNNVVECQEQCDDGNTVAGDGCSPTCRAEGCGNSVVEAGEECDDGNTSSGDCCSAACQREPSLDVDGNGRTDAATDIVYVARHLLGLAPVPPSFRTQDPAIPADDVIAGRVDALGVGLDVDSSGVVGVATDVVYIARQLLGLAPVPPSFRTRDPGIPSDATITANIRGMCGGS